MPAVHELAGEHLGAINALNFGTGALNSATINLALAAIGGLDRALLIPSVDRQGNFANWTIDANVTVPANVTLIRGPSGALNIQAGITWTQNTKPVAGAHQIWNTAPGGTLVYNAPGFALHEWDGGLGTLISLREGVINPETAVIGVPGSVFVNRTEPATIWLKETGFGNVGWVEASNATVEALITALDVRVTALELPGITPQPPLTITINAAAGVDQLTGTFPNPAGARVIGITSLVQTSFGTSTAIDIGDATNQNRWGTNLLTTAASTSAQPGLYIAPVGYEVRVTTIAGGLFDGTGSIDVQMHYQLIAHIP